MKQREMLHHLEVQTSGVMALLWDIMSGSAGRKIQHPPCSGCSKDLSSRQTTPNMEWSKENLTFLRGLVQISATLLAEAMEHRVMDLLDMHSLMKWCQTSMYFMLL